MIKDLNAIEVISNALTHLMLTTNLRLHRNQSLPTQPNFTDVD